MLGRRGGWDGAVSVAEVACLLEFLLLPTCLMIGRFSRCLAGSLSCIPSRFEASSLPPRSNHSASSQPCCILN